MASETTVKQTETSGAERTRRGPAYRPRVDILETSEELTLVADLPGVKSEQVDIDFEDGMLPTKDSPGPVGVDILSPRSKVAGNWFLDMSGEVSLSSS